METWKLLLLVFLSSILLGCIAGIIIGKIQLKMMRSSKRKVFSRKEILVLTAIVVVGVGCVLLGAFLPPNDDNANPDDMMTEPGVEAGAFGGKGEVAVDDGGKALILDDGDSVTDEPETPEAEQQDNEAEDDSEDIETLPENEPKITAANNSVGGTASGGGTVVMVRPAG